MLLLVSAFLLASRDLWNIQARGVGAVLRAAGVPHRVITNDVALRRMSVGELSRSGGRRGAPAPVIELRTEPSEKLPAPRAAALVVVGAGLVAALTLARRLPAPVKGGVLVIGIVAGVTAVYQVFWSLPPLDTRFMLIDWRTSCLVPLVGAALLFAYDVFPLPGNFVVKTGWLAVALVATWAFSLVRLAFVAAGYAAFGPAAFLPLFTVAGTFWDLLPAIAILAATQATLAAASARARPAAFWRPSRRPR